MNETAFLATITPSGMRQAMWEAARRDPAVAVLFKLLGSEGSVKWAHTLGVLTVPELAEHQPPVPPLALRRGAPTAPETYLWRGLTDATMFARLYEDHRSRAVQCPKVLDFACGSGRIARFLLRWRWEVHGCDIEADRVHWCQENLPEFTAWTNEPAPSLDCPDHSFDYIYCYSVFTHTPEDVTFRWLEELHRVLVPGGLVALTTNGPTWLDSILQQPHLQEQFGLPEQELTELVRQIEEGVCVFRPYPRSTDYGLTFIHPDRVAAEWGSAQLELVGQESGLAIHESAQDVSIFVAR